MRFLLCSFLLLCSVCAVGQSIKIHSIGFQRQSSGDNGYTLNGTWMTDTKAKLLNLSNFGLNGTYPKSIVISNGYVFSGTLSAMTNVPKSDVFFFGAFNKNAPGINQFSNAEKDSLYKWSMGGGKMIIGASPNDFGLNFSILDSLWKFKVTVMNPSMLIPTAAGLNTKIFNGPFGVVNSVTQGGSIQGYFNELPTDAVVLAENINGKPTFILDCKTLDLIVADVDVFTSLGGNSPGPNIINDQDRFLGNVVSFLDSLQSKPEISVDGNDLSTGVYSNYQWYLNGEAINGANGMNLAANGNGAYTVGTLLDCGCLVISEPVIVDIPTQMTEPVGKSKVLIYPNPGNGLFTLQTPNVPMGRTDITIYDITGVLISRIQSVSDRTQIQLEGHAKGLYVAEVRSDCRSWHVDFLLE